MHRSHCLLSLTSQQADPHNKGPSRQRTWVSICADKTGQTSSTTVPAPTDNPATSCQVNLEPHPPSDRHPDDHHCRSATISSQTPTHGHKARMTGQQRRQTTRRPPQARQTPRSDAQELKTSGRKDKDELEVLEEHLDVHHHRRPHEPATAASAQAKYRPSPRPGPTAAS